MQSGSKQFVVASFKTIPHSYRRTTKDTKTSTRKAGIRAQVRRRGYETWIITTTNTITGSETNAAASLIFTTRWTEYAWGNFGNYSGENFNLIGLSSQESSLFSASTTFFVYHWFCLITWRVMKSKKQEEREYCTAMPFIISIKQGITGTPERRKWESRICGEVRNAYKILVRKPQRKVISGRRKHRWGVNIKLYLAVYGWDLVQSNHDGSKCGTLWTQIPVSKNKTHT